MLGMAALPFAVTGTNLAIPLIKEDFGSSLAALSWTLSGYSIIIAALTMLGGVISVRIGTLRAFQIGIGIFVAASAVCAFAPNIKPITRVNTKIIDFFIKITFFN